jgi:hypothetical protein
VTFNYNFYKHCIESNFSGKELVAYDILSPWIMQLEEAAEALEDAGCDINKGVDGSMRLRFSPYWDKRQNLTFDLQYKFKTKMFIFKRVGGYRCERERLSEHEFPRETPLKKAALDILEQHKGEWCKWMKKRK